MKLKLTTCCLVLALALPVLALPPVGQKVQPPAASVLSSETYLNVNSMLIFVLNQGNYAYDAGQMFGRNDGCYYPYTSVADIISGANDKHDIFDAGIWVGAIDSATGETRVSVAEYSTEFTPGNMIGGYFDTSAYRNPLVRAYKLYAESLASNPNADYTDWTVAGGARDQGAPVDTLGNPAMIGDQMVWGVYNDADTSLHKNKAGSTNPMGLEISQTSFAFSLTGEMSNCSFIKYKIKNKGNRVLQDVYIAPWSDIDDGGATDDLNGCDTILKLGYIYNGTNNDAIYGSKPPAVGTVFFQGPLDSTGNPSDIGIMWGGKKFPGNRNLPMSAYAKYINGTDPQSAVQSYNYMRGLQRDGSNYTFDGAVIKFQVSGDPVNGTGDVDFSPSDRRMFQSTGPFTFRPGDSTEIAIGIVMGQGSDRLTSITAMKYYTTFAQKAYNENFILPKAPFAPEIITASGLKNIVSITWTPKSELEHGDYPFQGYTVYQGVTAGGPWTRVANYDIVDGIGTIFQNQFDITTGVILFLPVKFGTDNGVRRYFETDKNALTGNELSNNTQYYYKIEAYSYDPTKLPPTLTSQTVVTVTPQGPLAGKQIRPFGDSLATTHIGNSDGGVSPLVVTPDSLKNNTYRVNFTTFPETLAVFTPAVYDTSKFFTYDTTTNVCFILPPAKETIFCVDTILDSIQVDTTPASNDTTIIDTTFWTLKDLTNNVVVYDSQFSQVANNLIPIFDGIQLNVSGPPPGLKSAEAGEPNQGWSVPGGTRRFTTLGGADGLALEGFRNSVGWANPNSAIPGGAPAGALDLGVKASQIKNVELRLAQVDGSGNFNPADSNVSFGYRYGRHFYDAPAHPAFAPFIVNTVLDGYSFQDFTQGVPLSVWNTETTPPTRLAVGFLENNVDSGMVDGKYWPPFYNNANNTSATGPREWLFIFNTPYTETADPALEIDALTATIPIMYVATWANRDTVGWFPGDRFALYANHINLMADTFTFAGIAPVTTASNAGLNNVRAVPNPYYLNSTYDTDIYHRQVRFTNLPQVCRITIYNLGGDLVATVNKNSQDSWTIWNLQTSNGVPVASGIYVYVVDAAGYGTKTGKLAVFTEVEQLKTY